MENSIFITKKISIKTPKDVVFRPMVSLFISKAGKSGKMLNRQFYCQIIAPLLKMGSFGWGIMLYMESPAMI